MGKEKRKEEGKVREGRKELFYTQNSTRSNWGVTTLPNKITNFNISIFKIHLLNHSDYYSTLQN